MQTIISLTADLEKGAGKHVSSGTMIAVVICNWQIPFLEAIYFIILP